MCPNSSVDFKFFVYETDQKLGPELPNVSFWKVLWFYSNCSVRIKGKNKPKISSVGIYQNNEIWRQQTSLDTTIFSVCQEFVNLTLITVHATCSLCPGPGMSVNQSV